MTKGKDEIWNITVTKTFEKDMRKLPLEVQLRVRDAVLQLSQNPYQRSPLKGFQHKYWKIRVGSYRIIYRVNSSQKMIFLMFVKKRSSVYRKF